MPPKTDRNKERRVVLRSDDEWLAMIDDWRGRRRPIPTLSEAIRRLVSERLAIDDEAVARLLEKGLDHE